MDAELWASGWLGRAWVAAPVGEREPEHALCVEVVGRAAARPSAQGLAVVAALRRVAPLRDQAMLDETVEVLAERQPAPRWLPAPVFVATRAW